MRGRRSGLLAGQRLEYIERQLSVAGDAVSCAENQARMRVPGGGLQDLARLLYSESGIPFQKSCSVTKCNFERSNRLRNAVQLAIH